MILFPRLHLFEIGDQPWCPDWLLAYIQSYLTSVWNFHLPPFTPSSPATTAADLLASTLPNPSSYTYVDLCAGGGGPTATMEAVLNARFRAHGHPPAAFVLTDLHPRPETWAGLAKRQTQISFVERPVDAVSCGRITAREGRECRVFNLCFHHFDDAVARGVLRSAVQEGDAFIIFEFAQRNFSSLLNVPVMVLYPFFHTLGQRRYRSSPLHLLFTYLVPLFSLVCSFDGLVSTLRCRTPEELRDLLRQPDLDVSGWEFTAGNQMLAWPFLHIYWFMGVRK